MSSWYRYLVHDRTPLLALQCSCHWPSTAARLTSFVLHPFSLPPSARYNPSCYPCSYSLQLLPLISVFAGLANIFFRDYFWIPVCFHSVRTWGCTMYVRRVCYVQTSYWTCLNQVDPVFVCSWFPQHTPVWTEWISCSRIHQFVR